MKTKLIKTNDFNEFVSTLEDPEIIQACVVVLTDLNLKTDKFNIKVLSDFEKICASFYHNNLYYQVHLKFGEVVLFMKEFNLREFGVFDITSMLVSSIMELELTKK